MAAAAVEVVVVVVVPELLALLQVEVRGVQVDDWRLEVAEVAEKPRAPGLH